MYFELSNSKAFHKFARKIACALIPLSTVFYLVAASESQSTRSHSMSAQNVSSYLSSQYYLFFNGGYFKNAFGILEILFSSVVLLISTTLIAVLSRYTKINSIFYDRYIRLPIIFKNSRFVVALAEKNGLTAVNKEDRTFSAYAKDKVFSSTNKSEIKNDTAESKKNISNKSISSDFPRYSLGLVLLPSDIIFETEAQAFFAQFPSVLWRCTRMFFSSQQIGEDNYQKQADHMQTAAASFFPPPKKREDILSDNSSKNFDSTSSNEEEFGALDCIGLSCTSLARTLGEGLGGRTQQYLLDGYDPEKTGTVVSCDMAEAFKEALAVAVENNINNSEDNNNRKKPLRSLLITPYGDILHQKMCDFVKEVEGVEIVADFNFCREIDALVSALKPDIIKEKVIEMALKYRDTFTSNDENNSNTFDCAILCCSAMRVSGYGFVDELESELGKIFSASSSSAPLVVTSNQSMFRKVMVKGVELGRISADEVKSVIGYGKLFAI